MAKPEFLSAEYSHDLNPYIGQIAGQLAATTGRIGLALNSDGWALIEEVLSYAADAEQKIAEQKRHITRLESLSSSDELTGLANRRGLVGFLSAALARAERYDELGVIGFFDLDEFKNINDRFGHQVGDKALCHVATIMKGAIRSNDFAARIGGDEFVVVLDRSDWKRGAERLHQIQDKINDNRLIYGGIAIAVEPSLGVAPYGPSTDLNQLLAFADEAMFADKFARRPKLEKVAG